jgi:hypothetical protein
MGFPASVGVQDEQGEWNRSQVVAEAAWTWRLSLTIRCFLCRTAKGAPPIASGCRNFGGHEELFFAFFEHLY